MNPTFMSFIVGFWRGQNGSHFYELYCRLRIDNESHFHELYCRLLEGVGVDPSDRINPQPCVPSIVNTCIK